MSAQRKLTKFIHDLPPRTLIFGGLSLLLLIAIVTIIVRSNSRADIASNTINNQASLSFCTENADCTTVTSNQVSIPRIAVVVAPSPSPVIVVTPSPSPVIIAPSPTTAQNQPPPSTGSGTTTSPSPAAPTPTPPAPPAPAAPTGAQKISCSISFTNRTDKDHAQVVITAENSAGNTLAQATASTTDGSFSTSDGSLLNFLNNGQAAFITIRPAGYIRQRISKDGWNNGACKGSPSAFRPGDFAGKASDKVILTDVLALIQFYRTGKAAVDGPTYAYKDKSRVNLATILGFIQQYRTAR